MSRRSLNLLLAVCGVGVAWLIARSVVGLSAGLLCLMPAVVMALPLLVGRYIGAERVSRISRRRARRRRRVPTVGPVRRAFLPTLPRGGLLIAASLAVRPPPFGCVGALTRPARA